MLKTNHRLNLQTCPKVYIHETHRSRTPDETLRFIDRTKEAAGIMDYRDATEVDRIGIPVYTCHRIRPDNSRTSHTGKGVSKVQAQVSLMMESIERYSSEFRDEYSSRLIRGSYGKLGGEFPILDPQELILPQFAPDPTDAEIHWTWGYDILRREEILVPACTVYHPFHLDGRSFMNTHTNGLASGNTMEEAVCHAITEVIERDAWSIAKFRNRMDDALAVEDRPGHEYLLDLIRRFENAGIQVTAKDITADIGVPVVAAFSQDMSHPTMMPIDGFGAHLDPRVAMARALMEIATTRALFIQKHGIQGLRETTPYYHREEEMEDARFCARRLKHLGDIEADYTLDILTDIELIMTKLVQSGFRRIIAVDLTRPDVGIPTVRMIIPGMEVCCFDRTRRGDRLYGSWGGEE